MKTAHTRWYGARFGRAGFMIVAAFLGSLASAAAPAPVPAAPAAAPPLGINLNAFEAMKKKVALPDGITLAYLQMGDPRGQPVVLIHGYTDSARDWVPMLPYMPKRFRLILVDLRGHGQSSKPDCCYDLYDFAYDIKLLLDHLHVKKADIVGHSLGSLIAQRFAETWPQRTKKVVLISSTGGRNRCSPQKPRQFDFAAQIRALKPPLKANSPFMIAWWSSPTPVNRQFIRREREDAAKIPLRVWIAVLDQGLTLANVHRMLPRLKAPTLLIWGSKDPIMGPEDRASLRNALPHAQVKIFQGLGHNPFWEQPRAVARVIAKFLGGAGR
ncbi:MAG: alpha/beta hydrolase [Steroidobacteraceae bacterium]|nr:alpha/beta hydrolase [Steroidobacteraceae bacterium]